MAALTWTHQALEDLEAICLYIARDAPMMARVVADRVFRASAQLAEFPQLGRVVPEIGRPDIREVLVHNYRIIYRYRVEDSQVVVLTVHHGARILRGLPTVG